MSKWEVVGGGDKGGILVREGQDLKSAACDSRLSTGAVVEQLSLAGERLNYKLLTGTGPAEGWVSIKLSGKDLLVPKAEDAEALDPAGWADRLKAALAKGPSTGTIKEAAPWVKPAGKAPKEGAKHRLVFFNWTGNRGGAGSAHSSAKWGIELNKMNESTWEVCEVGMPGRGMRQKDPNVTDPFKTVKEIADSIEKAGAPEGLILLGFSFGAVMAYEVACALDVRGKPPLGLVVCSAEHPGWDGRKKGAGPNGGATKDMKDDAFEKMLHEKGGTEVILQNPDMKKMFMPVIKSDMQLEENYGGSPPEHRKLPCPIVVYKGAKCPQISRELVEPWLELTGCGDGTPTRIEELDTGLTPQPATGQPWLCDWYVLQGEPSMKKILENLAKDFGGK